MFKVISFIKQTLQGLTIYRVLFNFKLQKYCADIQGSVLDLASGGASYSKYFPVGAVVMSGDIKNGSQMIIDFNKKLPFDNSSFDHVLLFNALYIADDAFLTLSEINRILKKGGKLFLSSPFISNEMPEPHDYCRFTREGLKTLLEKAGYKIVTLERFGDRFSSVAYLLHPLFLFGFIRIFVNGMSLWFDSLIPLKIREKHSAPLGYFCVAERI